MSEAGATAAIPNRQKRKSAYRARHRLLSINRDATRLAHQRLVPSLSHPIANQQWPWIPNKQCGSWYLPPSSDITPVYFKSTDGHKGTYAFSLKRLNLHLLEALHKFGGCYLVDSSVRKILPDSFSRTIPIWCCVLNRIIQRYRDEMNASCDNQWDAKLYTPASIVSVEEHTVISNLIDSRVDMLYESRAVVDPSRLVQLIDKPLRARWFSNGEFDDDTHITNGGSGVKDDEFYTIVCYNPSNYMDGGKNHIHWISAVRGDKREEEFYYTPGASDDDATWARGLTHQLFWSNKEQLLNPILSNDDVDCLIDTLVQSNGNDSLNCFGKAQNPKLFMDKVGLLNLYIGSRKAGRPPECWEHCDAILNVTDTEYPSMAKSINCEREDSQRQCFYLMLPVAEGKRDKFKSELERWMPVGLYFLIHHLQHERRVLVHCAQGKDRSVAVVLALVSLICPLQYPLKLRQDFRALDLQNLETFMTETGNMEIGKKILQSGLPKFIVDALLEDRGHELFLNWVHQYSPSNNPLANKQSLRIGKLYKARVRGT
jgi:tRNA A64-2'-O-ribosylphosphate transferase